MSRQWEEATGALLQLAYIDEADAYEVDQAGIYFDKDTREFVLVTASGCSCWDGDCDIERFPSLDALEAALINDAREFNPTLKGAQELIADAHETFEEGEAVSYVNDLEDDKAGFCDGTNHGGAECPVITYTRRQKLAALSCSWRSAALGLAGFAGAFGGGFLASNLHTIHHITHAVLRFFGIPCP